MQTKKADKATMSNNEKKVELLSPTGDMESLISALDFGADAVYLAGKTFGMRSGAKNFTEEELVTAVQAAHERGVKVYITCNTVPLNGELDTFPECAWFGNTRFNTNGRRELANRVRAVQNGRKTRGFGA